LNSDLCQVFRGLGVTAGNNGCQRGLHSLYKIKCKKYENLKILGEFIR
jgi:hypothetical protein